MNEEKVVMATSKAEALEVEASGLRKDLIGVMDVNNKSKEKIQALWGVEGREAIGEVEGWTACSGQPEGEKRHG